MLSLNVEVMDGLGDPVGSAEVWELMDYPDAPDKARHLGTTDAAGRFSAPYCLMDTAEFERWQPNEQPVVFHLLVFGEKTGGKRVAVRPDTAQVLTEGNVVGATPEEYRNGVRGSANPEIYKRRAPVLVKVVL
jgi:hypothetical protein